MYHIITHNDLDGYGAAFIIKEFLEIVKEIPKDQILITFNGYNKDPDLYKIRSHDTVYITDYSLVPETMNKLLEITEDVTWIDHHKSALEYLPKYSKTINGKQIIGLSATAITFLYFYAPKEVLDKPIREIEEYLDKNTSKWINLIDAWDCWKLESKYRRQSELLNIYISNQLSLDKIEEINKCDDYDLKNILLRGAAYEEYKTLVDKNHIKHSSYEIKVVINNEEYKALMINSNSFSSLAFGDNINKYDICICYLISGNNIKVSLYSNKDYIDCSEICKCFNGGGHKSAAGFNLDFPTIDALDLFKKDAVWSLNINNWNKEEI